MSPEVPSFLRSRPRPRFSASRGGTAPQRRGSGASPSGETVNAELRAQRDRLLEKFTVMQADLGGAFYEMAIRDHVRLDVLTRKAAELQQVDLELQDVERRIELERSDAAGMCASCGAPFGHGVKFCAQCGAPLGPTGSEAVS